ncbi:HlyC/CorC family transporter [candidate division WOR-3 bacterium]|nr:HlyC/CorC family transporter [candidate division WOR-3 bacterium]
MIIVLIIDVILLVFTAFFNATEISFLSTDKVNYMQTKKTIRDRIITYYKNPSIIISTTLIGNNLTVIFISSLTSKYILAKYNDIITTLIITSFILIVGDIAPKLWARNRAKIFFPKTIFILTLFEKLFIPLIRLLDMISTKFNKFKIFNHKEKISKDQMRDLITIIEQDGIISLNEKIILNKMLNLENITVSDIIIPRMHVTGIDISSNHNEIKTVFNKSGFSRLLVYRKDLDHILGYIHILDFITQEQFNLNKIIKKILFIPPSKHINQLFYEMKDYGISIAAIIDEYGETEGIITIEDILEEMFGEIEDEFSKENILIKKIDTNNYQVTANCEIEVFNKKFGCNIYKSDAYETIGGYIIHKMGKIPEKYESIKINDLEISVKSCNDRKIKSIIVNIQI